MTSHHLTLTLLDWDEIIRRHSRCDYVRMHNHNVKGQAARQPTILVVTAPLWVVIFPGETVLWNPASKGTLWRLHFDVHGRWVLIQQPPLLVVFSHGYVVVYRHTNVTGGQRAIHKEGEKPPCCSMARRSLLHCAALIMGSVIHSHRKQIFATRQQQVNVSF